MKMNDFKYTKKQLKILQDTHQTLSTKYKEICLFGGRRSGKTFFLLSMIINRALIAPRSKHVIVRKTRASIKASIWNDTLKNQMRAIPEFKKIFDKCKFNESELTIIFPNGSEIILKGLDNIEKGLGTEMSTIYFNECSEIDYNKLQASSGLASKREIIYKGKILNLPTMKFYDFNPPYKTHWTYKFFIEKKNPITDEPLKDDRIKEMYIEKLNPIDNQDNIDKDYIENELCSYGEDYKRRFAEGEFLDSKQNALFDYSQLQESKNHNLNGLSINELKYTANITNIFIGIDPAVTANSKSDLTGIVVCGYGDGIYYILEDRSDRYTPNEWASIVLGLCVKWETPNITIETNQGGDLLQNNIIMVKDKKKLNLNLNFVLKRANAIKEYEAINRFDNPKLARAQAVKNLYDAKQIRQIDYYNYDSKINNLELLNQEMLDYDGTGKSPDRMDAMVYAMMALIESNTEEKPYKSALNRLICSTADIDDIFNF